MFSEVTFDLLHYVMVQILQVSALAMPCPTVISMTIGGLANRFQCFPITSVSKGALIVGKRDADQGSKQQATCTRHAVLWFAPLVW